MSFYNVNCTPLMFNNVDSSYYNGCGQQFGASSVFGYGFPCLDPQIFFSQYMQRSNMSFGNFGNFGNFNFGNFGGFCNWGGGINSTVSASGSSKTDPEQAKYNNLKSLLDKYVSWYENTMKYGTCDLKSEINEINKSKDSYKDKHTKLMALYNKIDETKRNEFLKSSNAVNVSVGNTKLNKLLDAAGTSVNNTSKTKAESLVTNATSADTKVSDALKDVSVVNLISNYNTSSRNLIEEICNKGLNNENVKAKAQALKDALVEEAKTQCDNLETDNKYYEKLEGIEINANNKATFISEFNKVYTYTRMIAAKTADKMLEESYGTSNSITTLTENDLKDEKSISTNVEPSKALKIKSDAIIGERAFESVKGLSDMEKSGDAEKALETLASSSNSQLKKLPDKVKIDNVECTVYQEMYGSNKLNYVCKDNKIYTVTLNPPTLGSEVTDWQQNIQERIVDAHNEEQKTKAAQAEAKRQLEAEKNATKNHLSLSIDKQDNKTKILKEAGKLLADVVYMKNKPKVAKYGDSSSFTRTVTLTDDKKIMVRKNSDSSIEVTVDTGSNSVIYKFKNNGSQTVQVLDNKEVKISAPNFKKDLSDALKKIFGEDLLPV